MFGQPHGLNRSDSVKSRDSATLRRTSNSPTGSINSGPAGSTRVSSAHVTTMLTAVKQSIAGMLQTNPVVAASLAGLPTDNSLQFPTPDGKRLSVSSETDDIFEPSPTSLVKGDATSISPAVNWFSMPIEDLSDRALELTGRHLSFMKDEDVIRLLDCKHALDHRADLPKEKSVFKRLQAHIQTFLEIILSERMVSPLPKLSEATLYRLSRAFPKRPSLSMQIDMLIKVVGQLKKLKDPTVTQSRRDFIFGSAVKMAIELRSTPGLKPLPVLVTTLNELIECGAPTAYRIGSISNSDEAVLAAIQVLKVANALPTLKDAKQTLRFPQLDVMVRRARAQIRDLLDHRSASAMAKLSSPTLLGLSSLKVAGLESRIYSSLVYREAAQVSPDLEARQIGPMPTRLLSCLEDDMKTKRLDPVTRNFLRDSVNRLAQIARNQMLSAKTDADKMEVAGAVRNLSGLMKYSRVVEALVRRANKVLVEIAQKGVVSGLSVSTLAQLIRIPGPLGRKFMAQYASIAPTEMPDKRAVFVLTVNNGSLVAENLKFIDLRTKVNQAENHWLMSATLVAYEKALTADADKSPTDRVVANAQKFVRFIEDNKVKLGPIDQKVLADLKSRLPAPPSAKDRFKKAANNVVAAQKVVVALSTDKVSSHNDSAPVIKTFAEDMATPFRTYSEALRIDIDKAQYSASFHLLLDGLKEIAALLSSAQGFIKDPATFLQKLAPKMLVLRSEQLMLRKYFPVEFDKLERAIEANFASLTNGNRFLFEDLFLFPSKTLSLYLKQFFEFPERKLYDPSSDDFAKALAKYKWNPTDHYPNKGQVRDALDVIDNYNCNFPK